MKYPVAPQNPEAVRFGRVSYTDAFRWLEESTPAALAFEGELDRMTQQWFAARPARARAAELIAALPRVEVDAPVLAGGRWFRTRVPEGSNLQVLETAAALRGPWRTVVDLNAMAKDEPLKIDQFTPSPDGRKLHLIWSRGGREQENVWVLDVDSGERLLDGVRQQRAMFPAWLADSSGFYYSGTPDAASGHLLYHQMLGAPLATQPEDFTPSHPFVWARAAADRRHSFVIADHLNPRPDYIRDESQPGSPWREFLKGESALFRGDIVGDRYIAVTNDGAPCGRVVSIPLATPRDRSTWRELIPGSASVLATLLVVDGLLLLADLVDTWARLRVFDAAGVLQKEIALPGRGALGTNTAAFPNVLDMLWKGGPGEALFHFSAPTQSPALYRVNVHTGQIEALTAPAVRVDACIDDGLATSADGARVPYRVVTRAGLDGTTPRPTVIYGYGGFSLATVPGWAGNFLAAWVQAGGVLVIAHLRGGAELGPQMWLDGRLRSKQNTFNDLYAIAGDLFARRVTAAAQLGVYGQSNGGVLVAAVTAQRPELFGAGIAQVPLTDVLACVRDPVTKSIALLDYGDPDDPEMSEVLRAWSPYQNVKDGTRYPALLFDAGSNDPRCPPWHSRKMAARLQQANAAATPILLRVRDGAGHGTVGVAAQQAQDADFLAFFADQLGLTLPG